jgi:hypothetical protein
LTATSCGKILESQTQARKVTPPLTSKTSA